MKRLAVIAVLLTGFCFACNDKPDEVIVPPDLVHTESGLVYYDSTVGTGREATKGDKLFVHYRYWLLPEGEKDMYRDWSGDTTKLEYKLGDSYMHERPYIFYVGYGEAIVGFEEALIGMKVGGVRHAIIPPALAYGDEKAGKIPPGATLKYLIELVKVQTPARVEQIQDSSRIQTTASGLQYIMITEGDGPLPQKGQTVRIHVTGSLEDGTIFDSSIERDTPVEIPLGVAPTVEGLDEGIALMRVGGKAKFIVPPDLGLGERGMAGVPPNSTLIFDVELLEIVATPTAQSDSAGVAPGN